MKRARPPRPARSSAIRELRLRLAEAEETLRAIRNGEVDAVVVAGREGPQVFTLEGEERAYRVLIESMNEGALTLTGDMTIIYANQCFARMIKLPLEQVMGGSFRRFLSAEGLSTLRPLLRRPAQAGSKAQVILSGRGGTQLPVQVSLRPLPNAGSHRGAIGMVLTDQTEARRTEALLRSLTSRVVRAQEAERGRVALELHDNITQLLCGIVVRSHTLADCLSAQDGPAKREAIRLREMLGEAAEAVERISRDLRPNVLNDLGLVAVLRATGTEFTARTGGAVELARVRMTHRLAVDTELTLYRILQEALRNVAQHAHAHRVVLTLGKRGGMVRLSIADDGVGFDPDHPPIRRSRPGHLGLLGMRERVNYVGGELAIKSARGSGTEVQVRIPVGQLPG